jgi:hypothetical protein
MNSPRVVEGVPDRPGLGKEAADVGALGARPPSHVVPPADVLREVRHVLVRFAEHAGHCGAKAVTGVAVRVVAVVAPGVGEDPRWSPAAPPTHAGMLRAMHISRNSERSRPRACGDAPSIHASALSCAVSAPRMRGCSLHIGTANGLALVGPAHAGMLPHVSRRAGSGMRARRRSAARRALVLCPRGLAEVGRPRLCGSAAARTRGSAVADGEVRRLPLGDPAKPYWTMDDIAAYWHTKPKTIRTYRSRGRGELPPEDRMIGRVPVWRPSTIIDFKRLGQGTRTDLRPD